jgi:NitT/TauT family transport system substrate-binding protein
MPDVVRERLSGFLSDRKAAPVFAIGPLERLASLGCVRPFRLLAEQRRAHNAAILVPPLSFKAKSSGLSLVANVADYVRDLPFTGYAANTDWAMTHKALLLGFLTAMAKGVDWFYKDENWVKESGSSREDVEMAYDYCRTLHIFDHKGLVEASSVGNLIKAMQDMGDLVGSLDVGRFIDPDITSLAAQVK